MKRCDTCQHGIIEGDGAERRVTCTLIPPTPLIMVKVIEDKPTPVVEWFRPVMKPTGWCGQHRLSWLRLFGYGTRA